MAQIIKGHQTTSSASEVRPQAFNFADISQEADGYRASVQRKAAEIIEKAKQEAEEIRKRAVTEGQQQALQQVEKKLGDQLEQRLQTIMPALQQAVDGIQQSRQMWLKHWENRAIHLAAQIAGRVVRQTLRQHPEISLEYVREALELVVGEAEVNVLLHPEDHNILKERIELMLETLSGLGAIQIVADPRVSPGGCKVVTRFGEVDQQIETQLDVIERELTD